MVENKPAEKPATSGNKAETPEVDTEAEENLEPVVKTKGLSVEAAIKLWVKATRDSKELAQYIANEGLKHFKEHGNTVKLQLFLDAIERHGKNYMRKAAFLTWMRDHAPITMKEGRLVKDHNREWDEALFEAALKQPFWDFAPDPENVVWATGDVIKVLESSLKRFEKDNYKPENVEATESLGRAKAMIEALKLPAKVAPEAGQQEAAAA